jgi:hypothetical protein
MSIDRSAKYHIPMVNRIAINTQQTSSFASRNVIAKVFNYFFNFVLRDSRVRKHKSSLNQEGDLV